MANYKLTTHTTTTATSELAFTASGTNTVVNSVTAVDKSASATVKVYIKKSAGTAIQISTGTLSAAATPAEQLARPISLEATDSIHVESSRTGTEFVISYVEESTIASGTALGGLLDVDTTGVGSGDVLTYNGTSSKWEPAAPGVGTGAVNSVNGFTGTVVLDTDDIAEGTTNLYHTNARVDAYLQSGSVTEIDFNSGSGVVSWNTDDKTLDLAYSNGVALQIGQEQHVYGKATEAISDGDVVMFAGAQGAHLLFAKADMSATGFKPEWIIGVATQSFALNDFGYVTSFGKVRGLNTSAYSDGDLLWLSSSTAGAFATSEPSPPAHIILVAAVVYSHATQGTIMVRVHHQQDTDETPEGSSNLYWTQARFDTAFTNGVASITSDDIADGATTVVMTTAERTKLSGIATGAEVNVQSDWTEVNSLSDAYIKNKPTIPTNSDQLTEGSTNLFYTDQRVSANTDVFNNTTKLAGIQAGAEVNVNADWNATTGDAAILNKPTLVQDLTDLGDTPAGYGTAGQVLATNSTTDGTEWVTVSGGGSAVLPSAGKFIIWAEETSTLTTATNGGYQWSFGNGELASVGLALPFDCTATQMLFNCDVPGTSVTIDLHKGTSASSASSTSVESITAGSVYSAVTTFSSGVSFSAGDWMTFRTSAATGSFSEARVGVVFEYDITGSTASITALSDTPSTLGTAGQALVINSSATGTEWATISGSGAVDSVNSQTGTVVLDTDDIAEGTTNLYYTDSRVSSYLNTNKIRANYPVSVKTASFTLSSSDEQTFMDCSSASGITVTIPTGLTRFSEFLFYQGGAGAVTITAGSGVTLRNTSAFTNVSAGQYAIIGLKKVEDTGEVYVLTGERKV